MGCVTVSTWRLKLEETIRDAETRVAHEQERAMELERLQQERGDILAVIAHELRNPISVARGNVEVASRTLGDDSPAKRYLVPAREALDRLSRLSGDLVEASRGQPAQMQMSPLDLTRTVTQACNRARATAENKGLTFSRNPTQDSVWVLGNSDALISVLGNLLSNAIRYTNPGGRISVDTGLDAGEAWIEVRDTGIGMAPEVRARIFEKFYRGPEARGLEVRGLGLGLSLVFQLIQAHKGRIDVETEQAKGSRFRIFIPLLVPAEKPASGEDAQHG